MHTKKYYPLWLILPAFIVFLIFFIIPNMASFVLGFTDWSIYYFHDIHFNGLKNFERLFTEKLFTTALKNTFYFAIVTVVMKNVIGLIMALVLHKQSKYNNIIRAILFMPITVSSIVVCIVFVAIYNPTQGILNLFLNAVGLHSLAMGWLTDTKYAMSAICAMEIWQWSGFNMIIFIAGLQSIPKELYESADIAGAGYWKKLTHVTLPLIVQSINVTFVFSMISGLKVFTQVYGTTNGGPAHATTVMGTYLYDSFADGYLGYSAAVGLVFTMIIVLLTAAVLLFLRNREVEL